MGTLTRISRPRRVEGPRPDRTERYELRTPEQDARRVERLALLACALAGEQAAALLEMLAAPHRGRAGEYLRQVSALDSAARQGRLSRELGERRDAPERLRRLLGELSPRQRAVAYLKLPPYLRTLMPPEAATAADRSPEEDPPALRAFAHRLVKEAVR
ncbi:MAG TPA: hypothetical protein VFB81_08245 [Myxococcales bacterium]|nr:hypothetical protein [Myxococcales bacterium]